jgi:hypothetical protein
MQKAGRPQMNADKRRYNASHGDALGELGRVLRATDIRSESSAFIRVYLRTDFL